MPFYDLMSRFSWMINLSSPFATLQAWSLRARMALRVWKLEAYAGGMDQALVDASWNGVLQPLPMGVYTKTGRLIARIAMDAGVGKSTRTGRCLLSIWK
jgi:hypothetical protein